MSILEYLKEEINPTHQIDLFLKENEEMVSLDPKFISRLTDYIDKLFPNYGTFDSNIDAEIRKVMKTGDGKDVKKIKIKIHSILMKCKNKLLHTLKNKVENIKVQPKQEINSQENNTNAI
jgi:hypothetical protein